MIGIGYRVVSASVTSAARITNDAIIFRNSFQFKIFFRDSPSSMSSSPVEYDTYCCAAKESETVGHML